MSLSPGTTELERHSLEAHVDLCAARYQGLKEDIVEMGTRIERLESDMAKRMDKLELIVTEIKDTLSKKETSALKTLVTIGISSITALLGLSGALLWYIITQLAQ